MFLPEQHPQQLTQVYPKTKRVFSYLLTAQVTQGSFYAPKVCSFLFARFLICVGFFFPPALLILPRE